ncbi:MAG: DUF481 domain-containing protein [Campylobacterota bacterium]|nr:DUF481 domain-containing protein [Campylobacterota bacterium]
MRHFGFNMKTALKALLAVTLFSSPVLCAAATVKAPEKKEEVRDTIVVHGMVLKGRVTSLRHDKLSFKLIYSEGRNHIAYKDIDSIHTKYNYHISYDRKDIEGRVIGIVDNEYLRVKTDKKTILVKIADIDNFVMSVQDDDSIENRIRNNNPYLSGSFNVGLELESAPTREKDQLDVMMDLTHKKAKNEIRFYLAYEFDTTQTDDTEKVQNKDELTAILADRYFYKANDFVYGSLMGEFDRPRHIQNRFAPSVGYGHRFKWGKDKWIQPAIGLAYVTTNYTEQDLYPQNNFAAAALSLGGKYQFNDLMLINSLLVDGNFLYYPSLADPGQDWISRTNIFFTIPLLDFLSLKLAWQWINDSNPDPSIGNNKTTTNIYFGFDF